VKRDSIAGEKEDEKEGKGSLSAELGGAGKLPSGKGWVEGRPVVVANTQRLVGSDGWLSSKKGVWKKGKQESPKARKYLDYKGPFFRANELCGGGRKDCSLGRGGDIREA